MKYKGIGISKGKALGKAIFTEEFNYSFNIIMKNKNEMLESLFSIFNHIIEECKELDNVNNVISKDICKEVLLDLSVYKQISDLVIDNEYEFAEAIEKVFDDNIKELGNKYSNEEIKEIRIIEKLIITRVLEITNRDILKIKYDFILIGKDITTSMLTAINSNHLKGIISEKGGQHSHTSIMCNNRGITAVSNICINDLKFKEGDIIFIDGSNGIIEDELDDGSVNEKKSEIKAYYQIGDSIGEMQNKKAMTTDGIVYKVKANIFDIDELSHVINLKTDGVGLLRTEFLNFNRTIPPSEELQYKTYKAFGTALKNKPLVIRTFDAIGDKQNIVNNKQVLKTQLRSILRASKHEDIRIMYPMVSNIDEIRNANVILREAMSELQESEIPYNKDIKIGIMVEVPSVALMADIIIDEVDFLCIGSNDLIKYTIAKERDTPFLNNTNDIYNPAIIRLFKNIIDSKKDEKSISICGEIATDPLYIILLVGMGIDSFSVNINSILKLKKYISLLKYNDCKKIVDHVLTLKTGAKIKEHLEIYAKKMYGIYLDI